MDGVANNHSKSSDNHTLGNTRWFASSSAASPCTTNYLSRAQQQQNSGTMDRLRFSNNHLESTVEELKLEIAFYKGEIKRLEVEKDVLKEDVDRVSSLFDNWVVQASGQAYKDVIGSTASGSNSDKRESPSRDVVAPEDCSADSPSTSGSGSNSGRESMSNSNDKSVNHEHSSKQDVAIPSTVIDNRRNAASTSMSQGISYIKEMVKYPCQSISDALAVRNDPRIWLITSCQSPYYIEYVSKSWCDFCGWTSSEALGMTCNLLQGPLTNMSHVQYFMRDVKELGYGKMTVCNYKKNGETFQVEVIVYPIFDSPVNAGKDSDLPVLTHYASVMIPVMQKQDTMKRKDKIAVHVNISNHPDGNHCTCQCPRDSHNDASTGAGSLTNHGRRRFDAKCILSSETFFRFGHTLRLSNLLRLMLSCRSAMVLVDREGRVVHVNQEFTDLSSLEISQIEGRSVTDLLIQSQNYIDDLKEAIANGTPRCFANVQMRWPEVGDQVVDRDGTDASDATSLSVYLVPIYGGYQRADISHFALLYSPEKPPSASSKFSSKSKSRSDQTNTTGLSPEDSDRSKSSCDQMGESDERSGEEGSSNATDYPLDAHKIIATEESLVRNAQQGARNTVKRLEVDSSDQINPNTKRLKSEHHIADLH